MGQCVNSVGIVDVWQRLSGKTLYFPLNFAVNIKLL
jgi:hypothetical protein